jgi:hypothetical protein
MLEKQVRPTIEKLVGGVMTHFMGRNCDWAWGKKKRETAMLRPVSLLIVKARNGFD